jgi:hypothetical protein
MQRLINSDSTAIELWRPINLRTPEDGNSTFSETSVRNSATWYKVPEDTFNFLRRESIKQDSAVGTSIIITTY